LKTKRLAVLPAPALVRALLCAAIAAVAALLLGAPLPLVQRLAEAFALAVLGWVALDLLGSSLAWNAAPLQLSRRLPAALAVGVTRPIPLRVVNTGRHRWRLTVFDGVDPSFAIEQLPLALKVGPGQQAEASYHVTPQQRGPVVFAPAQVRVRTLAGSCELRRTLGPEQPLRVYPNFAALARYAWLAGDRRLSEIGIKSYVQRGSGTDFKQLTDYTPGDAVRHIDWRATLKHRRPIVREFQDERDQRVLFVLDCGRRMRADEGPQAANAQKVSHFDEALNALMLLAYVALKSGDEVGALTFGTPAAGRRHVAPHKGQAALQLLTSRLYDLQPQATHTDYMAMALDVMRLQPKRSLVVVLTNFRDEDASELEPALKLLRTRHLVLLASLRETVLRELTEASLAQPQQAVTAATAHLFEQSRRDAFRRLAGRDALLIDVEPPQLAAALVNHYHAVKRAGLL
jgi:uncharacterized protein (DUF58 family)